MGSTDLRCSIAAKVTYAKVSPEKVARIVADHLVNGNVVAEYTVGSLMK